MESAQACTWASASSVGTSRKASWNVSTLSRRCSSGGRICAAGSRCCRSWHPRELLPASSGLLQRQTLAETERINARFLPAPRGSQLCSWTGTTPRRRCSTCSERRISVWSTACTTGMNLAVSKEFVAAQVRRRGRRPHPERLHRRRTRAGRGPVGQPVLHFRDGGGDRGGDHDAAGRAQGAHATDAAHGHGQQRVPLGRRPAARRGAGSTASGLAGRLANVRAPAARRSAGGAQAGP